MKVCICNNFNDARLDAVYADPDVLRAIKAAKDFEDRCDILYKAASGGEDPVCRSCFEVIEERIEHFISSKENKVLPEIVLPTAA